MSPVSGDDIIHQRCRVLNHPEELSMLEQAVRRRNHLTHGEEVFLPVTSISTPRASLFSADPPDDLIAGTTLL